MAATRGPDGAAKSVTLTLDMLKDDPMEVWVDVLSKEGVSESPNRVACELVRLSLGTDITEISVFVKTQRDRIDNDMWYSHAFPHGTEWYTRTEENSMIKVNDRDVMIHRLVGGSTLRGLRSQLILFVMDVIPWDIWTNVVIPAAQAEDVQIYSIWTTEGKTKVNSLSN